ncbi:MAG TPA: hydroxyacid dehydrogenase [Methylomirabilota bacterium]|nr:hydroxyacid dehydrogenase [Methylomirabilota bacterium]
MPRDKPLILADPTPRAMDLIFAPAERAKLERLGDVIAHDQGPMPDAMVDRHLPEATILVGQTAMPKERLDRARSLRAIFNVEGNFLPNIDYDTCFQRGIHVLNCSPVFALPVAELALGAAIDLARDISKADRDMRAGRETYGLDSNRRAFLLTGSPVGLIGFGDLGRALRSLLVPFHCPVKVYDPWLPERLIRAHDCVPAGLDEVLGTSRVIFVFAGVTRENQGFLGRRELALIRPDSVFLLMSRAAVVAFDAFVELVAAGRFRAATDVFPEEPVASDHPVRRLEDMLLSAHRAGGMMEAFRAIGEIVVSDAALILAGLPPVSARPAQRETIGRLRSKPVSIS